MSKLTGAGLLVKTRSLAAVHQSQQFDWDKVDPRKKVLYDFVASQEGPITIEELYNRVQSAGLHVNNIPMNERSHNFIRHYDFFVKCINDSCEASKRRSK